jgi:hypothetical protein
MTKFYFIKSFPKTIKIILLLLFFLFTATYSYSDAYRVENVIIQESFQNTKNFRRNLINKGIISSFEILSKRILLESQFWKIKNIDSKLAKKMTTTVSLQGEKKINNNYQINLSFLYDKNKVKNFFNSRNIAYTETISQPILLFPIIKENDTLTIWENNFFSENWDKSKYPNFFVSFLVPEGDIFDQKNLVLNNTSIREIDERSILQKYNLNNSLVLILDLDEKKNNVQYKINLSGVAYYKNFTKELKSNDTKESQFLELIDEIKYSVENLWKNKNIAFSDTELLLEFTAKISSLKQLNKLRNELIANTAIKKIQTLEISSKALKGKIYYTGSLKNLQEVLEDQNIFLKENFNSWVISYNG